MERLQAIGGTVPNLARGEGLSFLPALPNGPKHPECAERAPQLQEIEPGRWARCLYAEELR